jgi:methylase of polypeptide subunit release factors
MQVNDIVRSFQGQFNLTELDRKTLRKLRDLLLAVGYSESAIYKALNIQYFTMITLFNLPIFLDFKLCEETPFNRIVKLFLLSQRLPRKDLLADLFDEEDLESLCRMAVLSEEDGMIRAEVDIFPCMGEFVATDHHFAEEKSSRAVMFLGKDSYTLARGTVRRPVGRTLDLCTGSGIQALLAARHSDHVIGVDINARAINFANFNRIFNEVDNVTFLQGDLYGPVEGEKFDLILANPPFVPSPEKKARVFYRDGGFTGEIALGRILGNLHHALSDKGTCQIITQILFRDSSDYVEDLSLFIGRDSFDVIVFAGNNQPVESFVMGHLKYFENFAEYRKDLREWLQCHYENRITKVAEGLIVVARTPQASHSMKTMVNYRIPNHPFSHKVEECLEKIRDGVVNKEISHLYPIVDKEVKCLWQGHENDSENGAIVEFKDEGFLLEEKLSQAESALLKLCNGKRSASEIALLQAQGASPAEKQRAIKKCFASLKDMARKLIIRFDNEAHRLRNLVSGVIYVFFCASEEIFDLFSLIFAALA